MTSFLFRVNLLWLLSLPLTANSTDDGASNAIRDKVEGFVGYPIESLFCETLEAQRGAPVDQKTCDYLSRRSLETCWEGLTAEFPALQAPVAEYPSLIESGQLDRIREAVLYCVKEGIFLDEEDRFLHLELQNPFEDEREELILVADWTSAVESIVEKHKKNKDTILSLLEAFRHSDYAMISLVNDDLILGTVGTPGDFSSSVIDTPPDWVGQMKTIELDTAQRTPFSVSVSGESSVVTEEHRFIVQLQSEDFPEVPNCDARFATIDCGICLGMADDDLRVFVTWSSNALWESLPAESPASLGANSAAGGGLEDHPLTKCMEDGLEKARSLQ